MDYQKYIRNFSIIAHIDHGKSTLADRLIEKTGLVADRDMKEQFLDNMDLERERGITIKLQTTRLVYKAQDGQEYIYNLIDTPGHVDFTYEVSRSLAACEGAVLVVDATQGVEAQTLANVYLALDENLEILPVLNKMDLASARPDECKEEIEEIIGLDATDAPEISAKTGMGVEALLERIIDAVPAPDGDENGKLKALIFDSKYDNYLGVIIYARIMDGQVKKGDVIRMMATNKKYEVTEVGVCAPGLKPVKALRAGEVGYICASIKQVADARVGDTITLDADPAETPLPGYKKVQSMVFCGIYPADGANYESLKDALEKLQLNDASLTYDPETSQALGFGFRCGFLGLLHMEIIQERLEREFDLDLITTAPSVIFKVYKTDGSEVDVDNPSNLPPVSVIEHMEEPFVRASIHTPQEYVGALMEVCQNKRGVFKDMVYEGQRVCLHYEMPLAEIIFDFFDQIKSRSRGYASYDYELCGYQQSDLVKLDILLNGDPCDALSMIVHRDRAYARGRSIAEKLKDVIPRQMFEIPIQAAIGGKVIARETVKAMR